MDKLTKARTPPQASLTKTFDKAELELAKDAPNHDVLLLTLEKIERLSAEVADYNVKILDALLDADCTQEEYSQERQKIEDYDDKVSEIRYKINRVVVPRPNSPIGSASSMQKKRTFKLPKIELPSFNGDLKEWLGFWSQFLKIHQDEEIDASDKFQYLLQAMEKGSRARELVESYPHTAANYPKVITALQSRFGREELLVEVYVRELLKLVISNVNHSKEKFVLSKMFDKLESQLRALDTLGVTIDKNAAMLFPMVESSLPETILIAWQRSPLSTKDGSLENPQRNKLSYLMEFLKQEVENEERISLARSGFGVPSTKVKGKTKEPTATEEALLPTAAGLFSGAGQSKQIVCIFCEKSHESKDCHNALTLSLPEKRSIVNKKRCCYVCFRTNHLARQCKANVRCQVCKRRHYTLMCPDLPSHQEHKTDTPKEKEEKEPQTQNTLTNQTCTREVILQSLMVKIGGNKKEKCVRALIDTGSQRSYILKTTAKELNLEPVSEETMVHSLFGGSRTEKKRHNKFTICLKHVSQVFTTTVDVFDQDLICGNIPRVCGGSWKKLLKEKGIWLTDFGPGCPEIEILIGADLIGRILTGRVQQLDSGLTAIETHLGWTLMGVSPHQEDHHSLSMIVTSMHVRDSTVAELWDLETIGITDPAESKTKQEADETVWHHFYNTVTRGNDGRYAVSLPWISEEKPSFNTKDIAEKRLHTISKKLVADERLMDYQAVLDEWLQEEIIEVVPADEYEKSSYYLPHRPVFKEESLTTKIRPVFDASCKSLGSPSLNECLEKGPNVLEMIPAIMLRFREKAIGVTSDIRRAFLMIGVREEDRDYLRFLWWSNYEKGELQVFRHKRVVFGVNCSPFLLGAVIKYHLHQVSPDLKPSADKLLQSMYVDNCVTSVDTERDLQIFVDQATTILSEAKFELRMWQHSLNVDPASENVQTLVLGSKWDRVRDTLSCDLQRLSLPAILTKRSILSTIQKVYDPLGFLCPATLYPKLLLQEAWAKKVSWDQELPQDIREKFGNWILEVHLLSEIQIPRRATAGEHSGWSLHTFCDASKNAYAAAIFLRCDTENGTFVHLLLAKARVAPLKKITIPRLELLACTIGSRLVSSVKSAMMLENIPTYFWTDSTTVLAWVRRNEEWGTFVGNRVREIRSLTEQSSWRHIPGSQNPADLPSRGCGPEQLVRSKWWEGPSWLKQEEVEWPTDDYQSDEQTVISERKKSVCANMLVTKEAIPWYMQQNSNYTHILRVIAWMKRFVWNTKSDPSEKRTGELTVDEISSAETTILKIVQTEVFQNEKEIQGLQVQQDSEGIYRVKTKITHSEELFDFRYPILLPSKHPLVQALIREVHLKNCHAGPNFLLTKLREKFWILRSRRAIKGVIFKCVKCRRHEAKNVTTDSPPLPRDRIRTAAVFEVTGVDLAGPLFLRDKSKVWIVLYTCAVYRAIHLELVSSLSTECFLQSFRRFVSRRGRPSIIYSDNGTNFTGADNLFKSLDWNSITTHFVVERIQWKFNPPSAAWWGGWWERLVRMVKAILVRVLGRSTLTYEELLTIVSEAEAVINSRPLTYVSEETDDLVALTPLMFLQEIKEAGLPEVDILEKEGFQRRFRYRQKTRDELRMRFRKEYLGQLIHRSKEKKVHQILKVGDVVLVGADNKKRLDWPMARITKLITGKDGHVRVAYLKTANGLLIRPIQRLYPLEVMDGEPLKEKISSEMKNVRKPQVLKPSQAVETRTRSGRTVKVPERLGV